jgi:hypothetical protein
LPHRQHHLPNREAPATTPHATATKASAPVALG